MGGKQVLVEQNNVHVQCKPSFKEGKAHYDQNGGGPVHLLYINKIATGYNSLKIVLFLLLVIESIKCFQIICFKTK